MSALLTCWQPLQRPLQRPQQQQRQQRQHPQQHPHLQQHHHQQQLLQRPRQHKQHRARCAPAAAAAAAPPAAASSAPNQLREAVAGQAWGAASSPEQRARLERLVAHLVADGQGVAPRQQPAPTEGGLDGDWQLLWTSEASVRALVRRQLLAPVRDIQQRVDLRAKRVTNSIAFGWLGLCLVASGPLTVLSSSRLYYSFDSLVLRLLGLSLTLPLLVKGGGWTECVALLDAGGLRVMRNSRRDTLVLQRLPPS